MRTQAIGEAAARVFVLVFETGDEVIAGLTEFARREKIGGAQLSGIGAFRELTLGYFDAERGAYEEIPIAEQVEAVTVTGNLGLLDGAPRAHVHALVGRRDGTTRGGHLVRAIVHPTLELFVTALPIALRREADARTGLALMRLPQVDDAPWTQRS
jgi:uncharacterized protein